MTFPGMKKKENQTPGTNSNPICRAISNDSSSNNEDVDFIPSRPTGEELVGSW